MYVVLVKFNGLFGTESLEPEQVTPSPTYLLGQCPQ